MNQNDKILLNNPEDMAYSRAKTEAEKVALSYRDRVPVAVIRFPGVYGAPLLTGELDRIGGVTPISMIFSSIKRGAWLYIGDGQTLTHWIYVDDVVRGSNWPQKRERRDR